MGKLYIVVGPSGTGKSTLVNLLTERAGLQEAISHTTRAMRPGEVDGVTYHFISEAAFDRMVELDQFAEYVVYPGSSKKYGVSKDEIDMKLEGGDAVIITEGHGAKQLADQFPSTIFFLMPPSPDELKLRMINRVTRNGEIQPAFEVLAEIDRRLSTMDYDLDWIRVADHVISPGTIEEVYGQVLNVIEAERRRKLR